MKRRASGVVWLGDIPRHWTLNYLGNLVHVVGGSTPSKENIDYWNGSIPWVSPKDMKREIISDSEDHVSELALRNGSLRLIPDPAVLMVIRGMILDHTVPIARTSRAVTVNQDMKALRPRPGLSAEYLSHFLRAMNDALLARVEEAGHGTKALRTDLWRKLPVLVPPEPEQNAIVSFLNRKTATIDSLIAKKQRMIELLQEKRQAVMAQAVTKGIDCSVQMKASETPWLGHIPAHWEVHQLRRVVARFIDYRGRTPTKVDDGIPLVTAGAVRDGRIDHSRAPEYMLREEYGEFMRKGLPELGDVVFTTEAPLGEVAQVTDTSVAFAQRIILFKANRQRMTGDFLWLYYCSDAGRSEVVSRASGSTAEGIRADRLRSSFVPVPPIDEQIRIVEHVKARLSRLSPFQAVIESQVAKLRQYRQALITAAVTGKIDVSAEAA